MLRVGVLRVGRGPPEPPQNRLRCDTGAAIVDYDVIDRMELTEELVLRLEVELYSPLCCSKVGGPGAIGVATNAVGGPIGCGPHEAHAPDEDEGEDRHAQQGFPGGLWGRATQGCKSDRTIVVPRLSFNRRVSGWQVRYGGRGWDILGRQNITSGAR